MVLKLPVNTGYSFVFRMFSYHLGLNQRLWTVNNTPIIWKKYGILLSKLFLTTVRKNCSSDREFFLKFEAGGQEFANILRSLKQFIQTVKDENNFW